MTTAQEMARLETKVEQLKMEYEQYFCGMVKREPYKLRDEVQKIVTRWSTTTINNTMYKFRFRSLVARYGSMRGYWDRCLREIDEGTFKRDRFRSNLHDLERKEKKERRGKLDSRLATNEILEQEGFGERTDPHRCDALYEALLVAKEACGESTAGLDRQGFEHLISKQRELVRQRYDCEEVEFNVTVENAKVKLLAKPKKKGVG
jgi:hypothetical protein